MSPLVFGVYVFCACIVGASFVGFYLLAREIWDEHRANVRARDAALDAELGEWAENWCAEHVDPYIAQVEGEDWAAWEAEMRESAGGESRG